MKKELDYQFWGENEEEDDIIINSILNVSFKDWLDPAEDIWDKLL